MKANPGVDPKLKTLMGGNPEDPDDSYLAEFAKLQAEFGEGDFDFGFDTLFGGEGGEGGEDYNHDHDHDHDHDHHGHHHDHDHDHDDSAKSTEEPKEEQSEGKEKDEL